MALPAFLVPMLIAGGLGAISGGLSSWQKSRANRLQAEAAETHAASLEEMIQRMFAADTTTPIITAAGRQIAGQHAASGLAGSGMQQAAAAEAAASIMAQDLARKQGIEAQVRSDPSFRAPPPGAFRPGLDAFLGAGAGFAGGAGNVFGGFLGTETGAQWAMDSGDWLSGLFSGGGQASTGHMPQFQVRNPYGNPNIPAYVPQRFGVRVPGLPN